MEAQKYKLDLSQRIEIGTRIRLVRKYFSMNIYEFADSIYYSASHQSNLESGKKEVTMGYLASLHEKYGVSASYILHGEGGMFSVKDTGATALEEMSDQEKLKQIIRLTQYFSIKEMNMDGKNMELCEFIDAYNNEFLQEYLRRHKFSIK